jgi:hypothetical protein
MQVQIKFLVGGANSLIGGFCAGDLARVSAELARHLVDDVGVAKFADVPPVQPPPEDNEAKPAPKAKGKK